MLLGALRYGKPFAIDMLSPPLDEEALKDLLDPVLPGLLKLLLSKEIIKEENYAKLIRDTDGDEYQLKYWKEKNLEFFNFVVLTKTPQPPEWTHEKFFIIKTV